VDDLADAVCFVMEATDETRLINVGSGHDIAIIELTRLIADVVGFRGEVLTDPSKPDGAPRKLADISRLRALGWAPSTPLRDGIEAAWRWWRANP
jgi:GDP-L-fucose synthase